MLERIKFFLPQAYKNDPLAQSVLLGIEKYTDEIKAFIREKFQQLSVSTASEDGISEWEKEIALTPTTTNLEVRRAIVRARLMRPPTMTPERLTVIANQFTHTHLAKVVHPPKTYLLEIHVPLDDVISMHDLYNEVYIAKPAHLSLHVIIQILLAWKIHHRAECMQFIEARQCVWNLGSVRTTRWDGEFMLDGTIRLNGIYPDELYRERQVHKAEITQEVNSRQKSSCRYANMWDGSFCLDGSHRMDGLEVADSMIGHRCTVTMIKNGVEGVTETV